MGQHGPAIRFASIKDAAQRTGLPEERVRECCANNTRVGDLVFRFVKE
jgi:hypothetical protein